jgi:alanyl-tRNA synthetase
VRRIEAVSGKAAEELVHGQFALVGSIKELLKNPKDALKATENLVQENAELKKKIESLEARQLSDLSEKLLMQAVHVNGIDFIGSVVPAGSADALKKLCFDLKARLPFTVAGIGYFVVLAANIEGKASVAVMVDDTLVAKGLEAPKIIKEYITPIIKGGGGGQKTLATAGGQDTSNLQLVIDKVKALL